MTHIRSLFFKGELNEIDDKTLTAYQNGIPSNIIWNITNKCNLLCKHCYMGADCNEAENELTDEETIQLAHKIGQSGTPLVFITGGEPMMRPNFFEILEVLAQYKIKIALSSNATLITEKAADKLKEYGVDFVAISIYGPEEFHDEYVVVPGTFKRIMEAIDKLKERGLRVGVKCTVNQAIYPHFKDLIQVCKDIDARLIYACDQISSGRGDHAHHTPITAEQWQDLADFMLDEILADPDGMEYDIGAMPSIASYIAEKLVAMGKHEEAEKGFRRMRIKHSCPVGKGLMGINAEGNIIPCSFSQDFHLGNIREITIEEGYRRTFDLGEKPVGGKCGDCEFGARCRGCRVKAYHMYGDIFGQDDFCMLPEARPANKVEVKAGMGCNMGGSGCC